MTTIRPLELKDRALITSYLRRYPPEVSELSFTNLFVWRSSRPVWLAAVQDSIAFIANAEADNPTASVILGSPLGEASALAVSEALGIELEGFVRIAEETADALRKAGLHVEADRNNWDYVYDIDDLAGLKGRRYHKKRNLIKQCLAAYRCAYEPITPERIAECLDMQDRWCEVRECGKDPGLCNEYIAIREAFAHYESLRLIGGLIRINGEVQAYALGEALNPGTAVCHFEKAMPGMRGLSQLINQWFSMHTLSGFRFVNREQDLGIPGLRQAKESYYPHHMVRKFNASLKGADATIPSLMNPHECAKHTSTEV
ncbi:MAG: DUF2156 domain-containing protein [Desulfobacterales bacterium]|nr:MAG: DUF2156 domain-containing protein [Desulfobacterales bacterium]